MALDRLHVRTNVILLDESISLQDNVRTNMESVQCHHVLDIAYLASTLRGHCDVIDYVNNRSVIGQLLLVITRCISVM